MLFTPAEEQVFGGFHGQAQICAILQEPAKALAVGGDRRPTGWSQGAKDNSNLHRNNADLRTFAERVFATEE